MDDASGYAHQELRSVCLVANTESLEGDVEVKVEVEFERPPESQCWKARQSLCDGIIDPTEASIEILAEVELVSAPEGSCTLYNQDRSSAVCTLMVSPGTYSVRAEGFTGSVVIGGEDPTDECLTAQWGDESASIEDVGGYSGSSY